MRLEEVGDSPPQPARSILGRSDIETVSLDERDPVTGAREEKGSGHAGDPRSEHDRRANAHGSG